MTDEARTQLEGELTEFYFKMVLAGGGFLLAAFLMGIRISHRVAGPMYHFKRVFQEIKAGKKDLRIRLRPDDEFQDVAKSFNELMDEVQGPPKSL